MGEPRERTARLLVDSAPERARVRALVRSGRWTEAEPNPSRLARYVDRHVATATPPGAEAIQGGTNELQAVRFLPLGALLRRAVAYVEVTTPHESLAGTGFLVSPHLILTNCHVIASIEAARGAVVTFDRELDGAGQPIATTTFALDPDACALFSDPNHLDYALVALGTRTTGAAVVEDLGFIPLLNWDDKHAIGMPVNIIQHPRAWPKMVALRENFLAFRTGETLLYETDTDEGSSGSPVLNDDWELVALHHWGSPHLEAADDGGQPFPTNVNEGIRVSAICADLQAAVDTGTLSVRARELVVEALGYAKTPVDPAGGGRVLSPPHRSASESHSGETPGSGGNVTMTDDNAFHITVPLDITVRIGAPVSSPQPAAVTGAATSTLTSPPVLRHESEAVSIDPDYTNREGYDEDFITGEVVPLPKLADPKLAAQLAPLRPDEKKAVDGELKYEHFSVKLNKAKRMAIFTATNINGKRYLKVDRDTGRVAESEGDRWFLDTRVSASYFLGQDFYSGWSNLFDRGHLTRRSDPTWGTDDEAERANADTFHFTNCSPQHWMFNESAKYWQGLERYVLENGLLENDKKKRLCVLQGPLFGDGDRWADDVQIPSAFWKVVVWQGAAGLKSVGLVVDQLAIIDIQRRGGGAPQDLPSVDVSHWRVAIPLIEKRTGLDFGKDVRTGDTISEADQPPVGAEAAIPVRSFNDIRL